MQYEFERGQAYFATPCMKDVAKRFVVCIGRTSDRGVAFVFADDLAVGKLMLAGKIEGREFCQLDASNGHRYNVSAAVPVPAEISAEVLTLIRGAKV